MSVISQVLCRHFRKRYWRRAPALNHLSLLSMASSKNRFQLFLYIREREREREKANLFGLYGFRDVKQWGLGFLTHSLPLKGITELLMEPAKVVRASNEPPSSGTRNLRDNLSDLKAQVKTHCDLIKIWILMQLFFKGGSQPKGYNACGRADRRVRVGGCSSIHGTRHVLLAIPSLVYER